MESIQGPSRKSRKANCWSAMSDTLRGPDLIEFTVMLLAAGENKVNVPINFF